jgi:hypothetical protein
MSLISPSSFLMPGEDLGSAVVRGPCRFSDVTESLVGHESRFAGQESAAARWVVALLLLLEEVESKRTSAETCGRLISFASDGS